MVLSEIKNITLVLENCESIVIAVDLLVDIHFAEYKKTFTRISTNSAGMVEQFEFIYLTVNRNIKDKEYIIKRLTSVSDITAVEVNHSNKHMQSDFTIYTPWSGEDYNNNNQKVKVNDSGDIQILISTPDALNKNKELFDIFSKSFNDSKRMDRLHNLYKGSK